MDAGSTALVGNRGEMVSIEIARVTQAGRTKMAGRGVNLKTEEMMMEVRQDGQAQLILCVTFSHPRFKKSSRGSSLKTQK